MRLSAVQWACPHVGVSPQFWALSLSMFVWIIPKSDLCRILQSATKISSLLIMSLCSFSPSECWFSICAYLSHISLGGTTSHHTLLMRQDEQKDMFNVRSSSPAENVYKQYQLIVTKPRFFTHLASHLLIPLYKLTVFLCTFGECSSQHKHAKPIFSQQMQFSVQREPFSV